MQSEKPSPRRAGKAGLWISAIVIAIILVIFVGRNIWHDEAEEASRPSRVDPQNRPHSPHDLTVDPTPQP